MQVNYVLNYYRNLQQYGLQKNKYNFYFTA